jgi:hypothetical protein
VRRPLLATIVVVVAGVAASASQADSLPGNFAPAIACLLSHNVQAVAAPGLLPPSRKRVAAVNVSFALNRKMALNNGTMFFYTSPAAANKAAANYLSNQLKRFKAGGLKVTPAMVSRTFHVKNNVVVLWAIDVGGGVPPGHNAAVALVNSCIS